METATTGKVIVTAKVENLQDPYDVHRALLTDDRVRRVEVAEALVTMGATVPRLPKWLVARLGLRPVRTRLARTSAGTMPVRMYGVVRLTIQDREWSGDVVEGPDDSPMTIDRVTLHALDLVLDAEGQRLIGNPAHGGEDVIELY